MSGKPAAGAPRLLLYVESQDSAPPYLHDHLHRNTLYKPPDSDIRNTVYYKPEIDKLCVYGENTQRQEFYPVPRSYCKEPLKDDSKVNDRHDHVNVKREDANPPSVDYTAVPHSFHGRIPVEPELYQRCPVGPESSVSSMQTVLLQHGLNQLNDGVHSEINCSDKELSVDKSIVNYQFLEQSVTRQSIVNQGISILNQQVGVNRSEGDSGTAQQLVRTADGVVLAVLPPTVPHNGPEPPELSSRTLQSDSQNITVPLGWRRIVSGSSVIYVSPSGTALSTLPQLREYLQTTGTCKCGLPCPLRPETTFSFDPKVVSKPYQAPTGAELTKLCNHKRKLLATLSARAQSPATPPPPPHQLHHEQKKVVSTEFAVVKKKMKKRQNYPNMTVSQLMVQRDRAANEFKVQDMDPCRTVSPGLNAQRGKSQPCLPYNTLQNIPSSIQEELKTEAPVPRSSHYLTVNSGWIQQESIDQKNGSTSANSSLNVGLPVLGTNGQIIGVNTSYNNKNIFKNSPGVSQQDLDIKEEKKEPQYAKKEEESQVFSLNQLTPDVMQKINEQQQLFIQQNQKQIEMAMKGYRTQLENTNKPCQNQYMPGQLVIQNGAVVKTNPAKTPPWQVKRNDSMTSPSPKSQKSDNMDFDESNTNLSEESTNSNSSFHSEHLNQAMCSRVPPLPQQYSMMGQQWPNMDLNKKKPKTTKGSKKKASPTENKSMIFGNNGMRIIQDMKGKCDDLPHNNIPSFMEDPNGYLAQQTALLNNTISRQVGINSTYDSNQFDGSNNYNPHMQVEKPKPMMKHSDMQNVYRSSMASNLSPSPNTPDSSVLSDKNIENSLPQCCKGCNVNTKPSSEIYTENQIRRTYMKQNIYNKPEIDHSATSSPKHGFDDNPVTSSTFIDRSPMVNDNCGPIQAATVSTSNVSPTETLQPPEPSPTPSNSSRNTDTPHSQGSSSSQLQNCSYPMQSPAYSHPGSFNSNPSTPGYPYNSPGPPNTQSISGTQMMHFISNHNVNKNLMEVDNISMVGVKPGLKQEMYRSDRKRVENSMPGYCPPPHLGGGPAHSLIQTCYVQTYVTTMASGFSVTRDTLTSVLAGKAGTSTTSINASQVNFVRPPPPPSVNLATTYAIPNNHPDPFIHSVNLPTSYPLHIAGTTAQNMISKSPMEMVQNVIGSHPSKTETNNTQTTTLTQLGRRSCPTATPGQILISSTGQIMVSNSTMPPPPPKTTTSVSQIQASNSVTNVTSSVTQVMPGVVNQSAVVVNNLPTPYVIQPPMMAVDGPVVQQNTVLPQIMAAGHVSGQSQNERQMDVKSGQGFLQGVSMLSPENLKKKSKKKKSHANVTNVLQIAAPQQNTNNIMVHHSSPQHNTSPQFSPRGFQLSPNNNISPPMLQALTIVPGKSGTPAHIVMNGQGNTNNFGSQQIITNTSPSQQINLLQPVNLINNASGVVSNFGGFQQFILPNLGGMVMTADGTAIIQDNGTGVPMQLQLQTVNGQNVLTPVQNQNVFTAGANGGVVIRAQNQQGKIIQSQHSPGAQFLSPNNQVMMNSPNFNGQLSPLLANLSPTNVTFNTSPHQVRSNNVQTQEFIQTNQMGQTLMVPLSPKQVSIASATTNRSNSTFVQQNTTIVQQQTTLVSNSHNNHVSSITANLQGGNTSRLSIDPNVLLNSAHKQITNQIKSRNFVEMPPGNIEEIKEEKLPIPYNHNESPPQNENEVKIENPENYSKFVNEFNPILGQMQGLYGSHVRHSVSTQTLVNQQRGGKSPSNQAISGSSPPDTTTHSPLGALESTSSSPRLYGARSMSTQGNYADTTTKSPEPADANSSAMVQCVSSSEPDLAEREQSAWSNEFGSDCDTSLMSNIQQMRQTRHTHNSVESTEIHYNHNPNQINVNQQNMLPITPSYYDRQPYKRKNDFTDGPNYRNEKIMRTAYNMVHGQPKDSDYDNDKTPKRHFSTSGSSSDNASMQKVFDRHNLGNDAKDTAEPTKTDNPEKTRKFNVGDLIWGPVKGYASWPGKLAERTEDGRWSVQWFGGDKALGTVEDARLLTLSEGLEAHHAARTKHRKSRKLNTHLENAIQEAMAELDKKSENVTLEEIPLDAGGSGITETPKRGKKEKKKEKFKKTSTLVKIAPHTSKTGDGARLRSAR